MRLVKNIVRAVKATLPPLFAGIFSLWFLGTFLGPGFADYRIKLPGNYQLQRSSTYQAIVALGVDPWTKAIPTRVMRLGFSPDFIIAERFPVVEDSRKRDRLDLDAPDYWIIDLRDNTTHGPLDEREFSNFRAKLQVPTDIQLRTNCELQEKSFFTFTGFMNLLFPCRDDNLIDPNR